MRSQAPTETESNHTKPRHRQSVRNTTRTHVTTEVLLQVHVELSNQRDGHTYTHLYMTNYTQTHIEISLGHTQTDIGGQIELGRGHLLEKIGHTGRMEGHLSHQQPIQGNTRYCNANQYPRTRKSAKIARQQRPTTHRSSRHTKRNPHSTPDVRILTMRTSPHVEALTAVSLVGDLFGRDMVQGPDQRSREYIPFCHPNTHIHTHTYKHTEMRMGERG